MNTYNNFVIGYLIFWALPFLVLILTFWKIKGLEKRLDQLRESQLIESQQKSL